MRAAPSVAALLLLGGCGAAKTETAEQCRARFTASMSKLPVKVERAVATYTYDVTDLSDAARTRLMTPSTGVVAGSGNPDVALASFMRTSAKDHPQYLLADRALYRVHDPRPRSVDQIIADGCTRLDREARLIRIDTDFAG